MVGVCRAELIIMRASDVASGQHSRDRIRQGGARSRRSLSRSTMTAASSAYGHAARRCAGSLGSVSVRFQSTRAMIRSLTCGGSTGVRRDRGVCLAGYEPFHLVTVPGVLSPGWRGTGWWHCGGGQVRVWPCGGSGSGGGPGLGEECLDVGRTGTGWQGRAGSCQGLVDEGGGELLEVTAGGVGARPRFQPR